MESFDIHILKSKSNTIAFHSETFAMFSISDKIARTLELYEKSNSISHISRILDITKHEIRGVLDLFDDKTKNSSYLKKSQNRNDGLSELVLFVTYSCNFKCGYCCAPRLSRGKLHMDLETGKKAIATFLRLYPNKVKTILFFGGEPLIKVQVISDLVEFTGKFCRANQIDIMPRFGIVTNGALLAPKVISFLKEHDIMVTVSLDGPPLVNDFQRIFPSGDGTYNTVVDRINGLKRALHSFNIEATVTRKTIESGFSVKDILLYLHTLGAKVIHIMPVCGSGKELAIPQEHAESLASSFKEAASYTMESLLTDIPVWLQYVRYILESLITNVHRRHLCFAGLGALTVFPSGDVYPCYFLVDESLLMGNIFDYDFPTEKFFEVKKLFLKHSRDHIVPCKWCWARNICYSCYGFGSSETKPLSSPPEKFCLIQKAMIEAVLLKLAEFRMHPKLWPKIVEILQSEFAEEKSLGEKEIPIQTTSKQFSLDL